MRIIKIRFKNLNSLMGEWEIDLAVLEQQSGGIFAICGPTGAGKSTLLDALCLALFGATPRLGKITKSTNDIMSKGTSECSTEVVFVAQQREYRVVWSQRRSRKSASGELQNPKHEFSLSRTGEILESGTKDVALAIEQATGMNFERFSRSCLLAQGAFGDFLRASPSDRAPLLEQITGSEIYSRISVAVHERTALARKRRDEAAAVLVSVPEPEPDSAVLLSESLKSFRQQHAEKMRLYESMQADMVRCSEGTRIESQIASNSVALKNAVERMRTCQPRYAEMKLRCDALQLRVQAELATHAQQVSLEQRRVELERAKAEARSRQKATERNREQLSQELERDERESNRMAASLAAHCLKQEGCKRQGDDGIAQSLPRMEFVLRSLEMLLRRRQIIAETHLTFDGVAARGITAKQRVAAVALDNDDEGFIAHARAALVPGEPCPVCLSRDHSLDHQIEALEDEMRKLSLPFALVLPELLSFDDLHRWQNHIQDLQRRQREFETGEANVHSLRADLEARAKLTAVKQQRLSDFFAQLEGGKLELEQCELRLTELSEERKGLTGGKEGQTLAQLQALLQQAQAEAEEMQKFLLSAELERDQRTEDNVLLQLRAEQLWAELSDLWVNMNLSTLSIMVNDAAPVTFAAFGKGSQHLKIASGEVRSMLDTLQLEIARCEIRLSDLAERQARYHAAFHALQQRSESAKRWQLLHDLIGSQDGKKYRNFVQSVTLGRLLQRANGYLRTMSDRYLFVPHPSHPLAIAIEDLYHGTAQRTVANLSGGETFLLSLALALGLAGLSSRRSPVESLFVDEGFGSLDEASLDVAIDALSALNQAGKAIGVISHVLHLRERIPVRIEVIPGSGGRSTISGPGVARLSVV